jgi:hypothetical protein
MSVTKEKMLWRFEELTTNAIGFFGPNGTESEAQEERDEIDDAIRNLIENGPEVDEEFVHKWVIISWGCVSQMEVRSKIIEMLCEAGMRVRKSK